MATEGIEYISGLYKIESESVDYTIEQRAERRQKESYPIMLTYQEHMSNEIREKDHEWVKAFHSNFDRLLALLEKLLEKRQPSAYGMN